MIARWLAGIAVGLGLLAAAPAHAQVNKDMIVVTGSRVQSDDEDAHRDELPYVSIAVPADFVIFTVKLETATRSPAERAKELEQTFKALATKATRAKGVAMEVGEPGNSAPLETAAANEAIEFNGDRSTISIVLKFSIDKDETFAAVRSRAESFIEGIQVFGRVEATTGDLQYIGVADPKKHREALLRKIADDTKLLQSIFASGAAGAPSISLTGLSGRVRTRPSGPLEMEIYLPYSIVLGSPQPQR